jgi:PfaD family protein
MPVAQCSAEAAPLHRLDAPVYAVRDALEQWSLTNEPAAGAEALAPPLPPERLGDPDFLRAHGLRYPYVACALANGISGVEMVATMAEAGMLSFFGAGGLAMADVEAGLRGLARRLSSGSTYGANLVHQPDDAAAELAMARLFIDERVPAVSASAFVAPTPAVVLLRARGLRRDGNGAVVPARSVFAKVSRPDMAAAFLRPPAPRLLADLVGRNLIDASEAALAGTVPLATDITLEGDSGGHTDGLPTADIVAEAVRIRRATPGADAVRIGAAGGIGTPAAMAAAFAAGAGYVVTGSINQASVEADTSALVKRMLASADLQHTDTAPSAYGFVFGTEVQVLRRGTLFPHRGRLLYRVYLEYHRWEDIPAMERCEIEERLFRAPFVEIWREVRSFLETRAPEQLAVAERDERAKMARVFQWYLGRSSEWAQRGVAERKSDFQVWCGPSMGAFNRWVRGSALEPLPARGVAVMARALLHGTAVHLRGRILALQGARRGFETETGPCLQGPCLQGAGP